MGGPFSLAILFVVAVPAGLVSSSLSGVLREEYEYGESSGSGGEGEEQ